jgi:hypothetical protein
MMTEPVPTAGLYFWSRITGHDSTWGKVSQCTVRRRLRADAQLCVGGGSQSSARFSYNCVQQIHLHQDNGVGLFAQESFGFQQFKWRQELFKQNIREALSPEVLAPAGAAED